MSFIGEATAWGEDMAATNEIGATRRTVLASTGAVGVSVALAGCGSDDKSSTSGSGPGGAGVRLKTGDVPVGGGKVFQDQRVVVTQPAAGQFKAFTATCTHQGCLVGEVVNGTIKCPCHGSAFSAADGSVKNGPATVPLTEKTVNVSGDTLTVT
jgi:Rieske Fe-S protein